LTNAGSPSTLADRRGRRLAGVLALLSVLGLVGVVVGAVLSGHKGAAGDLYFTTYQDQSLYKVKFQYVSGRPQFGSQTLVARLPAADGVTFTPDGKALVGGQTTGMVLEIDPATGHVSQVASGCGGSFLLASSPSAHVVYTAALPGSLCAVPVDPLRAGTAVHLSGDDTLVTDLAFDGEGDAFYTTGVSTGPGNFGTIDLGSGTTTRQLSSITAGHGIAYDPYSRTLFLFGGGSVLQIDPRHPQQVVSSMVVPSAQFDNGTTDGLGHLYVASNTGELFVVDYHQALRLGDPRDVVTQLRLHDALDDVAPLIGPGTATTAGRRWVAPSVGALVVVLVLALGYRYVPAPRMSSRLPEWDIRRKEADRRRRRGSGRSGGGGGRRSPGRPARPGAPSRGW
jgi:hypothetical protein